MNFNVEFRKALAEAEARRREVGHQEFSDLDIINWLRG